MSKKKYLLTPVIIPFIIGLFIGSIGYFYEGYKNENLVRELKNLKIEKNKQIDYLHEIIDEAEPFFNLEEEKRLSIEQEYYQKKRDEAKKKQEETEKERKARREEIKLQQKERYEEELKAINSYITNIEEKLIRAKDILSKDTTNLKSSDEIRMEIAKNMRNFGLPHGTYIKVTDKMNEEERQKAIINNVLVELKGYMYDAGNGLLVCISSIDEVEQAEGSSTYVIKKGFAQSQLRKLEKEIDVYKSKYNRENLS